MLRRLRGSSNLVLKSATCGAGLQNVAVPLASGSVSSALTACAAVRTNSTAAAESFLNGTSGVYVEEMYRLWKKDPASVHASWSTYFKNVEAGLPPGAAFVPPPSLQPGFKAVAASVPSGAGLSAAAVKERIALTHLIRAYQVRGHEVAVLDPLGLRNRPLETLDELDYRAYGFVEADLGRTFDTTGIEGIKGFLGPDMGPDGTVTLKQLLERLQTTYCGTIGWDYMHMSSRDKCNWIRERIEVPHPAPLSKEKRLKIFDRLAYADHFERYLAGKFNTAKRFGVEGAESLIPGIKAMIDRVTQLGVSAVVFGMAHRGRLNVLVNVIRKPMEMLLKEFQGTHVDLEKFAERVATGDWSGSGDVKYHLGTSFDRAYPDGRKVHLALVANPSHLEAVNTVVLGKVRAKQDISGDTNRTGHMGILIHGDAAFAGQGIVYETFLLARLKNYGTGGTVHIILNNQVGFTTDPESARSTLHCSDLGKAFDVPIFHVNGDDPEAVTRVFELAGEYRQQFGSDVIVDLVAYRRHGHNELDQAAFTQPLMYAVIAKHPTTLEKYQAKLSAPDSGTGITAEECVGLRSKVDEVFAKAWANAKNYESKQNEWLASNWQGFHSPHKASKIMSTGVPRATLEAIGKVLVELPPGFKLHDSLVRILRAKEETLKKGEGLDWATGEALAFGSLLLEGMRVRLSGQDVERGTFSHRHAVLHDQITNATHVPLAHVVSSVPHKLTPAQAKQAVFLATNSPLSEYGVMGFELGYSLESPTQLNLWEAQFGDFVNGAQSIVDEFLSSGESKWYRQCGLTLLLPHGYEGQGPDHSSCRIERFLQMVDDQEDVVPPMAEDVRMQIQHCNMQVVNVSTPANYFHVLRRQLHRSFRKPLVIATPKSLLRHKSAVSSFADMSEGTRFLRLIPDTSNTLPADPAKVRRIVFCTGKIYYELEAARAASQGKLNDVAIVRVEQIAPFPFDKVADEMKKYPAANVVWCQEEPRNMGAWAYVAPRFATAARILLKKPDLNLKYAGRKAEASPATGSSKWHDAEQHKVVAAAFA